MPNDVLMYWKAKENDLTPGPGNPLRYAYRKDFGSMRDGDTVWIVTIPDADDGRLTGGLVLVGPLINVTITERAGAERLLGLTDLHPSKDYAGRYVVGSANEIKERDLISVAHLARHLRFHGKRDRLTVDANDGVTAQQFQSLRYLTANSAILLQAEWETPGRRLAYPFSHP